MGIGVLLIALVTAISSSIIGVFLVLRKMSMMTDAISHTVLLGIVLAFLIVPDLNSPFLIIGAVLMGLITVFLTESLIKTKKINEDAATGIIFPLLFSIAIIIISLYISGIHMDTDAVLLGKLEFSSIKQLYIKGKPIGPVSLYISLAVLLINILYIKIFYKELKIVSFDPSLAAVLGFSPVIIHYSLMALVSLTAVTSFSSVGSILVVALMVGPGITAMQFTKDLKYTIIYSALIAVFNTLVGYFIAILLNVTIAGVIASVTLLTFLIVITFFPKGIIFKQIRRNRQKNAFNFLVFLKHLYNHLDHENKELELNIDNIHNELNWSKRIVSKYIKKGLLNNYLKLENNLVIITTHGIDYHNQIMKEN